jgi:hypothetical protein
MLSPFRYSDFLLSDIVRFRRKTLQVGGSHFLDDGPAPGGGIRPGSFCGQFRFEYLAQDPEANNTCMSLRIDFKLWWLRTSLGDFFTARASVLMAISRLE